MKKIFNLIGIVFTLFILNCSKQATVSIVSQINSTTAPSGISTPKYAPVNGTAATITNYLVKFVKIEIGNSESDKFTLWSSSSSTGDQKDIFNQVTFSGIQKVKEGNYKYVRLTIDPTLSVSGYIDDNGTNIYGTATLTVSSTHVWGISGTGADNLLTSEITIQDGGQISLDFNVMNTLVYSNGLELTAPELTFSSK